MVYICVVDPVSLICPIPSMAVGGSVALLMDTCMNEVQLNVQQDILVFQPVFLVTSSFTGSNLCRVSIKHSKLKSVSFVFC